MQYRAYTPSDVKLSKQGPVIFSQSLKQDRPGFVVMKNNPSASDDCWQLRCKFCSQSIHFLRVKVCIDSLIWCENLLISYFPAIPPYIEKKHFWCEVLLFRSMNYSLKYRNTIFRRFTLRYSIHFLSHATIRFKNSSLLLQENKKTQVLIFSSCCFTISSCSTR